MDRTIDPQDDWFWNPANPASPLNPAFNDDTEDEEDSDEGYMDSGSQFGDSGYVDVVDSDGRSLATTGLDSDYETTYNNMALDDGYLVPLNVHPLSFPQVTGGEPPNKSTSLFEDMWIYLRKKLFGGNDAS